MAYILARLDRDGHAALAAKVRALQMSASSAAIAAGYHKPPPPLPGPSPDEEQEMWMGPAVPRKSVFPSEAAARACWLRHRDYTMQQHGGNGHRPHFWWLFECPFEFHFSRQHWDQETALLFEHNLLEPKECERLVKHWRREYDYAQRPGFTYLTGKYTRLEGQTAKLAHYKSAGIPRSLIEQWDRGRS